MCGNDISTIAEPDGGFTKKINDQIATGKVVLSTQSSWLRQPSNHPPRNQDVQDALDRAHQRTGVDQLWFNSSASGDLVAVELQLPQAPVLKFVNLLSR